jgi:hypothetical protein
LQQEAHQQANKSAVAISSEYLDLLDWEAIFREMLVWRRERNFLNMTISREVLRKLLDSNNGISSFYSLYASEQLVTPRLFVDIFRLQLIVLDIIKKYAERYYILQRQMWESETLEYRILDRSDPNLNPAILPLDPPRPGYVVKINRNKPELVKALEKLIEEGEKLYKQDQSDFPSIVFDRHLYAPLISQGTYFDSGTFDGNDDVKSVPIGLNRGETRFVWNLRKFIRGEGRNILDNCTLYLLRNLSRGKGVGFFEASNFYPDFILWLVSADRQVVTFIDPKGLAMLRPNNFAHPKIQLFKVLQEKIAPRLEKPDVILDAYVVSDSDYHQTIKYFGDPGKPYAPEEFAQNHVLFPNQEGSMLLQGLVESLN